MATPSEKLKRLRLSGENPFPSAYKTPTDTLKGGSAAEALRAKRERQKDKDVSTSAPTKAAESKEESTKSSSGSSSGKSFSQAFRDARAEGKDTFTWNGKKYTTEMAGAKKPAAEEASFESPAPEVTDTEEGRTTTFKRGGMVRSSASKRADGCAQRGKTRGRMV
jgi:hypothetical protein